MNEQKNPGKTPRRWAIVGLALVAAAALLYAVYRPRPITVEVAAHRPGDPAKLFARAGAARERLGWTPRYTRLEEIVETAWKWFESHPRGYRA